MKNLAFVLIAILVMTSCQKDMDEKMEKLMPTVTVENVVMTKNFVQSGSFKGVGGPGVDAPIVLPGSSISFDFYAGKGQHLMFTTMYGASKDWFFAPSNPGLSLYNDKGEAMTGDVSDQVRLYDNGTKNDQSGDAEDNPVAMVNGVDASMLIKLELAYNSNESKFTLTITNTSGGTANETPFSPGVWSVSNVLGGKLVSEYPFFKSGEKSNEGVTAIAEGGNITPLYEKIMSETGIITGLSPVLVVVHENTMNPIFELNKKDAGNGLKEIAQTGDSKMLKEYLEKMPTVRKVYIAGSAPIGPGEKVMTQIEAYETDKISYVTMFGYSNDWFFANVTPVEAGYKGDITGMTSLLDDGTAVDQFPGAGNGQGLFGGMMYMEDNAIANISDKFPVPAVNELIKVTIN